MRIAWCVLLLVLLWVSSGLGTMQVAQTFVQPHVMAWQPPSSSETPDQYCIYRAKDQAAYTLLACVPASTLTYTDTALIYGSRYCYKATSKKGATESAGFSEAFCVSALATVGR